MTSCGVVSGIEVEWEWRDHASVNNLGRAEPTCMKRRTEAYCTTSITCHTRADGSNAWRWCPLCKPVMYERWATTFW